MRYLGSVIRIGVTVAVLNATARVGFAYWAFYQFKDHAQQAAIFGAQSPPEALHQSVVEKANELFLPVEPDQVSVSRDGLKTFIDASYIQPIEYFPNQRYPLEFTFSVEGVNMAGFGR